MLARRLIATIVREYAQSTIHSFREQCVRKSTLFAISYNQMISIDMHVRALLSRAVLVSGFTYSLKEEIKIR
jgi:hypothetical protein